MDACTDTGNDSVAGGVQEIALEFDRCEILCAFGKIIKYAIATGGICKCNDRSRVQVPIGSQQFRTKNESSFQKSRLKTDKFNSKQAGKISLTACVDLFKGCHRDKV